MSISSEDLLEAQKWRYATKLFDSNKEIPAKLWNTLEEALILSPSSYGLQPWKFIVITDRALREKLVPHSWNQRQVADASHLVVFAVKKKIDALDIDAWVRRLAEVRGVSIDSLEFYRGMMLKDVVEGPRSQFAQEWAIRQVYIALGNFMTSAALLGIDTCPMEGILPEKYDEVLGLSGGPWATAVACPAGYRSISDKYAALPKVRFSREKLIEAR